MDFANVRLLLKPINILFMILEIVLPFNQFFLDFLFDDLFFPLANRIFGEDEMIYPLASTLYVLFPSLIVIFLILLFLVWLNKRITKEKFNLKIGFLCLITMIFILTLFTPLFHKLQELLSIEFIPIYIYSIPLILFMNFGFRLKS